MDDRGAKPPEPEEGDQEETEPEMKSRRTHMHVYNRDQVVIVTFNPAPDRLELPPRDALRLGRELIERAKRALRNRSGRIPRA
jgi:hypothetical protein